MSADDPKFRHFSSRALVSFLLELYLRTKKVSTENVPLEMTCELNLFTMSNAVAELSVETKNVTILLQSGFLQTR